MGPLQSSVQLSSPFAGQQGMNFRFSLTYVENNSVVNSLANLGVGCHELADGVRCQWRLGELFLKTLMISPTIDFIDFVLYCFWLSSVFFSCLFYRTLALVCFSTMHFFKGNGKAHYIPLDLYWLVTSHSFIFFSLREKST